MIDYKFLTDRNTSDPPALDNFPDVRAINASGPLATDGTEIIANVLDDVWAEKQALLDFYDYPPLGIHDEPGLFPSGLPLSQPLALQYMNYGAPGTIVNWASEIDPALLGSEFEVNFQVRLLLLHGQGILRADYKMLDSIVYAGDPNNATADAFYHADDSLGAVRNITGDWLILPDARGYSFRALDPSGLIDPDGAGRLVGSQQEDAMQNIASSFIIKRTEAGGNNNIVYNNVPTNNIFQINETYIFFSPPQNTYLEKSTSPINAAHDQVNMDISRNPNLKVTNPPNDETRQKNIATHFAIHY